MAILPTVAARNSGRTTAADTTTHAITLPTHSAGQLLVVVFSSDGNATVSINTGSSSANWQILGTATNGSIVRGTIVWKIAASGSETLTLTTSAVEQSSHVTLAIDNAQGISGTSANGSSTNSNPPSHDAGASREHLWIATRSGDSTVVATVAPTNYLNLQTLAAAGTGGASTNTAERSVNPSQTEDPGTFTSATEQWVSWTLAVWNVPLASPAAFFPAQPQRSPSLFRSATYGQSFLNTFPEPPAAPTGWDQEPVPQQRTRPSATRLAALIAACAFVPVVVAASDSTPTTGTGILHYSTQRQHSTLSAPVYVPPTDSTPTGWDPILPVQTEPPRQRQHPDLAWNAERRETRTVEWLGQHPSAPQAQPTRRLTQTDPAFVPVITAESPIYPLAPVHPDKPQPATIRQHPLLAWNSETRETRTVEWFPVYPSAPQPPRPRGQSAPALVGLDIARVDWEPQYPDRTQTPRPRGQSAPAFISLDRTLTSWEPVYPDLRQQQRLRHQQDLARSFDARETRTVEWLPTVPEVRQAIRRLQSDLAFVRVEEQAALLSSWFPVYPAVPQCPAPRQHPPLAWTSERRETRTIEWQPTLPSQVQRPRVRPQSDPALAPDLSTITLAWQPTLPAQPPRPAPRQFSPPVYTPDLSSLALAWLPVLPAQPATSTRRPAALLPFVRAEAQAPQQTWFPDYPSINQHPAPRQHPDLAWNSDSHETRTIEWQPQYPDLRPPASRQAQTPVALVRVDEPQVYPVLPVYPSTPQRPAARQQSALGWNSERRVTRTIEWLPAYSDPRQLPYPRQANYSFVSLDRHPDWLPQYPAVGQRPSWNRQSHIALEQASDWVLGSWYPTYPSLPTRNPSGRQASTTGLVQTQQVTYVFTGALDFGTDLSASTQGPSSAARGARPSRRFRPLSQRPVSTAYIVRARLRSLTGLSSTASQYSQPQPALPVPQRPSLRVRSAWFSLTTTLVADSAFEPGVPTGALLAPGGHSRLGATPTALPTPQTSEAPVGAPAAAPAAAPITATLTLTTLAEPVLVRERHVVYSGGVLASTTGLDSPTTYRPGPAVAAALDVSQMDQAPALPPWVLALVALVDDLETEDLED